MQKHTFGYYTIYYHRRKPVAVFFLRGQAGSSCPHLAPLQAGLVSDVDAAVAEFRDKVTAAGLEACREGFKEQWADYCAEYNYQ